MTEITEFLNRANPDFDAGFALFCKYSPNQNLISWIGRKRDFDTLMYELKKIQSFTSPTVNPAYAPQYTIQPQQPVRASEPAPQPETESKIIFKTYDERRTKRGDLPEDLQKIYDDTVSEYPVRRGYHEKMKNARTDADRAEYRSRIIECQGRIMAGWEKIDSYLQDVESKKLENQFNESSCRAYISKALKNPTKVSDKVKLGVRVRYQALIEHNCAVSDDTRAALAAPPFNLK